MEAEVSEDSKPRTDLTPGTPLVANITKPGGPVETPSDDFGTFSFKNLDVLKQANDDVIRKLRSDSVIPPAADANATYARKSRPKRSSLVESRVSSKLVSSYRFRSTILTSILTYQPGQPPSPSTSTTSSVGSGFSRPSLPNTPFAALQAHKRTPSNAPGSRLKAEAGDDHCEDAEGAASRRSMPGNVRRASLGTMDKHFPPGEGNWHQRRRTSGYTDVTPASSVSSPIAGTVGLPVAHEDPSLLPAGPKAIVHATEKTVDCLIAEDSESDAMVEWMTAPDMCPVTP